MSTGDRAVMLSGWAVKAAGISLIPTIDKHVRGMHVKLRDQLLTRAIFERFGGESCIIALSTFTLLVACANVFGAVRWGLGR